MSRYIGCESAREQLDAFIDQELPVEDQVMVESHLRWCRTCGRRVEDLRLIGSSLRLGSPGQRSPGQCWPGQRWPGQRAVDEDPQALSGIQSGVLMRIRAEREQSFGVRFREMFSDMHLLWPALGATTALLICVTGAFSVLQASTQQQPESLAEMISSPSQPGSERNPLRPDNWVRSLDDALRPYVDENRPAAGISIPRTLDDGGMFEGIGNGDAVFALSTVVSRDGRIANYEVLSEQSSRRRQKTSRPDQLDAGLADAVMQSRFAPAQRPGGSKVAVNMVWLIIHTTAEKPASHRVVKSVVELRQPVPAPTSEPAVVPAVVPEVERRSSTRRSTATA
jgi:hypothetical protein